MSEREEVGKHSCKQHPYVMRGHGVVKRLYLGQDVSFLRVSKPVSVLSFHDRDAMCLFCDSDEEAWPGSCVTSLADKIFMSSMASSVLKNKKERLGMLATI